MNKKDIIKLVENIINDSTNKDFPLEESVDSSVESFIYNVARRLVNTKNAFTNKSCGYADYMVSLRNFLIAFQTSIEVKNVNIPNDNPFGIYKNATNSKFYAAYDIPEFVKHQSFVRDAFINVGTEEPINKTKYLLKTNTYVEFITGFKYFKSLEQKLCVYGGLNTPSGYTSLISMPTGGGKSLVTQSLAYEKEGLTIVVVPTISLAIDQERVAKKNIKTSKDKEIFCYYSGINNFSDISNAIRSKTAKLLFISPEALIKNKQFQKLISEANERKYIKNRLFTSMCG